MQEPKQHLYGLLTNDAGVSALVGDRVHLQNDDETQNVWDDRFPMITYYRIGGTMPQKSIKRIDRFQVTAWDTTNLGAETLSRYIVALLKNRTDDVLKNCIMVGGFVDLFDATVKAHGVAMTFDLVMAEGDQYTP